MKWIGRAIAATLVLLMMSAALPGCATDGQLTRTQGAAAGLVVGGVAGKAIGGNRKDTAVGMATGTVVGLLVGDHVAAEKERYVAQEEELRASAERATALARESQQLNQHLAREIASLNRSVQQLRSAKLSAESGRAMTLKNRERQQSLLASVDVQLRQLREETWRQAALLSARAPARTGGASAPPSRNVQLVSTGIRQMDQQTRALEQAKATLLAIDQRRAY